MTDRKPHPIAGIQHFAMSESGDKYSFTLTTMDGISLDLEIAADKYGPLMQYLVYSGAGLARERVRAGHRQPVLPPPTAAIPIDGIAMMPTDNPEIVLLSTRHYWFDLAFETPRADLKKLSQLVDRMATMLDVESAKPN